MNISAIVLSGHKLNKQEARENLGVCFMAPSHEQLGVDMVDMLSRTTIGSLDRKVKHGQDLTFEEAFCGMCYVLAATNARLCVRFQPLFEKAYNNSFDRERILVIAAAFLNLMAAKESFSALTPAEVAGMVAAAMMDLVVKFERERVIETCGMGGDKGFQSGGVTKKSINASTLSSLVLAALGEPAIKHGSYGNTSAVGSTEMIESFGALTSMTSTHQVEEIWEKSGFCFFDAHWCKTIHDLSHLLMMETINHVIGPMTPPITCTTELNKLMGVNEKVHPSTIARAYAILHERKLQKVGGVLVVSGLDEAGSTISPHDHAAVRKHVIVDEVSPYGTVVSAMYQGDYLGTTMIHPEDFGITLNPQLIQVSNLRQDIEQANIDALSGTNPHYVNFLAMNAALGLYASTCLRDHPSLGGGLMKKSLRDCFARCHNIIMSGAVKDLLIKYVEISGGVPKFSESCVV